MTRKLLSLFVTSAFLTACATAPKKVTDTGVLRMPASIGASDLSTTEVVASGFAIKENGIKITEIQTTTVERKAAGKYGLEIDGVSAGMVRSAVGEAFVEWRDGEDVTAHKSPLHGKIIIIKDFSADKQFREWYSGVLAGKVERKSVSVIIFNDDGREERKVTFYNSYPTKWVGPNLNARNSGHATEAIEIVFETHEMK